MRARGLIAVILVVAVAQVALALGLWLLARTPVAVVEVPAPPPSMAPQRLAEALAATAFRAVITADYASLGDVVRRTGAWPEVAFLSVEDSEGRILAHTDSARVGKSAKEMGPERVTDEGPISEFSAAMVGQTRAGGAANPGRVRLGWRTAVAAPVTAPVASPETPSAIPPFAVLGAALLLALPVGYGIVKLVARLTEPSGPVQIDLRQIRTLKQAKWMLARAQRELEAARHTQAERAAEARTLQDDLVVRDSQLTRAQADLEDRLVEMEQLRTGFGQEREQFAEELTRLSTQLMRAHRDGETLDEQLTSIRSDLSNAQAEAAQARTELAHGQMALGRERAELGQIRGDLEQAKLDLGHVQIELEQAHANLGQALGDLDQERAALAQVRAELERAEADFGRAQADLAQERADLEQARAALERIQADLGRALADLEEERVGRQADLARERADVERVNASLELAQWDLRQEQASLERVRMELDRAQGDLGQAQTELGQERATLAQARADLGEERASLEHVRTEFERTQAELGQTLADLGQERVNVGQAQADLDRLRAELEQARLDREGTQAELEQTRAALAVTPTVPRDLVDDELKQLYARAVAYISFAVRGSLTNVLGWGKLLMRESEGPLTDAQRAAVLTIQDSGQRLLGLVNDLVDLARIDAKMLDLQEERVDVPSLVREVVTAGADRLGCKPEAIGVECPSTLPPARGDRQRLRQVLLTLMQEPPGTGPVRFTVRIAGEALAIAVEHPEWVVHEEELADLFDPFAPLDPASPVHDDGGRLRLALARSLGTLGGATLAVESRPGAGTAFTLTVPTVS